jgi:hypothetical protein
LPPGKRIGECAPDLGQRTRGGAVVDASAARIAGPFDCHERCQHCGDLVAITAQLAARAVVRAIGQALGNARTARAVLR